MSSSKALTPSCLYEQSFERTLKQGLVDEKQLKTSMALARDAVDKLRSKGKDGSLEMLESAFWKDDIPNFSAIGTFYRRFHSVVVIGMGGAALSGKALCSLYQSWIMSDSSFPFIYFLDNLDPEIFWELMSVLNPKTTGIVVISKSGETTETIALFMRCLEYWKEFLTPQEIGTHFTIISRKESALARLTGQFQMTFLEHPQAIGGRFSCFTLVGLLPLIMVGGDPRKVRQGGSAVVKSFFADRTSPPLEGAALLHALYENKKLTSHVLFPYGDAFTQFVQWCRQLVAESLGKQGQGITPLSALGPCDQHSQLQLYLDGPKDKFFTLLTEKNKPREKVKPDLWASFPEVSFLAENTLEDLLFAHQRATAEVLVSRDCPVREICVKTFNESSIGALFAHFMLETLVLAELMGINPLDQPAVESIKVLAKRFLKPSNREGERQAS